MFEISKITNRRSIVWIILITFTLLSSCLYLLQIYGLKKKADAATKIVYRVLQGGDLRTAHYVLSDFVKKDFLKIDFISGEGKSIINVPIQNHEHYHSWDHGKIQKQVNFQHSLSHHNGILNFHFSRIHLIFFPFLVSLSIISIFLFLLYVFRKILMEEVRREYVIKRKIEIGEISAQVAHDIRSPLRVLKMVLNKSSSSFNTTEFNIIKSQMTKMEDIISDLDLRKHRPKEEKLELKILIEKIKQGLEAQFLNNHTFKFNFKIGSLTQKIKKFDAVLLERGLTNIINNSIESFSDEGGVVEVVAKEEMDKWIHIKVKDNGPGIPKQILKDVFKEGFSYGKTGQRSGQGLGLYSTKKLMQKWKGSIQVGPNNPSGVIVELKFNPAQLP